MQRRNIASVFKWELRKHIKSPIFLIFTFLIPGFMILGGFLPNFVVSQIGADAQDLYIRDETAQLAPLIEDTLRDSNYEIIITDSDVDELEAKLEAGEIPGYLHITEETLASGQMTFYLADAKDISRNDLQQSLQPAYTQYRLQASGVNPEELASIMVPATVNVLTVSGEEQGIADILIPMFTGMILFISILFSGQILMQSVIKEKRNRIIEILLSSLSARELLVGKILAFGALGLIQIGIWLTAGLTVATRFMDLSALQFEYTQILTSLPYFVLGYLLLATMFAAMAAMMKDAESGSQAHGLVIMIPILPLMLSAPIMMAPNHIIVRIVSFIPIFTPATMLMRMGATTVPAWEIIATSLALLAGTIFFLYIGARIYGGSLLKYDTASGFKDVIGLLKNKD
ncbi:MAG: ABC transporter permease [Firmicutes bacterium]|nr:ABC transporter permease [Bacillota bacterium]